MEIKINNRAIGNNHPVFIIAELSANHNQDYNIAVRTIKAIKACGADAVKLQTYTPDTVTINCDNKYFRIKQGTIWDGKTFYQLYKEAYTPWEWQPKLKKIAQDEGLICFSSVNDKSAVDFLEGINMPAYKLPSFEITDVQLIKYIASKNKPVIFSTGIATLSDIKEAINICRHAGNNQIAVLKCTSAYPSPLEEVNLRTISDIKKRFKVIAGLSDHTLGIAVPTASVSLDAKIIEKHFILDRKLGGPDAAFSLEPNEFREMVEAIRNAEAALGKISYKITRTVKKSRKFSRSLFVVKDIKKGEVLTEKNVRSIRPGYGLHPKFLEDVLGRKAGISIKKGTPLKKSLLR